MNLIGVNLKNFYELCSDVNEKNIKERLKVNIPLYQRPYKWGEEEEEEESLITRLICDYKIEKDNKSKKYFIGTVLTVENSNESKFIDLIDGQQRVTTIFLINYVVFLLMRPLVLEYIEQNKLSKLQRTLLQIKEALEYVFLNDFSEISRISDYIYEIDGEMREKEKEKIKRELKEILYFNETAVNEDGYCEKEFELLNLFFKDKKLTLTYSRNSFNEVLKSAMKCFVIKHTVNYKFNYKILKLTKEDDTLHRSYTNAMKLIFENFSKEKEKIEDMLSGMKEFLENISICRIHTGDYNDAYTLFEVLNDRALALDELDLIKNSIYKSYYNKNIMIENNNNNDLSDDIEKFDKKWVDIIFAEKANFLKGLILSLSSSYLLGVPFSDDNKSKIEIRKKLDDKLKNEAEFSKEKLEEYLEVFENVSIILKKLNLQYSSRENYYFTLEYNSNQNSIIIRTLALAFSLKQVGVMCGIIAPIIDGWKRYNKTEKVKFENYLEKVLEKDMPEEYKNIEELTKQMWRIIMMSKNFNSPLEFSRSILKIYNYNDRNKFDINTINYNFESLEINFENWLRNWTFDNNKFKIKILLLNLNKNLINKDGNLEKSKNGLVLPEGKETLELEHLEPKKQEDGKYFNGDQRDYYINSLGNMTILKKKVNASQGNNSLYLKIKEVYTEDSDKKIIVDFFNKYSENNIVTQEFFMKRQEYLIMLFKQILKDYLFL
ncbi:MAG: GmrSD restriction endonuclease domain-containing protein [Fusobacteriaceae bacterium]